MIEGMACKDTKLADKVLWKGCFGLFQMSRRLRRGGGGETVRFDSVF